MILVLLFGSAFAGDTLTAKAISFTATRVTDEIHEYISAMTTVADWVIAACARQIISLAGLAADSQYNSRGRRTFG